MRVMSARHGYRYLLKSVAVGDGDRSLGTPLTRYYAERGNPPGRWAGRGLHRLGDRLRAGGEVTEEQLQRLLGAGRHPVTAAPLGAAFRVYRNGGRRAVAGFDFTFSVPKSISVLWGVADAGTQALIVQAHHAAVADVLGLLEHEVAATRIGAAGPDGGAVAQVAVAGVVATVFDHYDSRAGDPQLHAHAVISNKVPTLHDGKWRALDGRPLHAATVALSEHFNAVLADHLTRTLGVTWERRERGRDRNPAWEIAGVPPGLVAAFSSRSRAIEVEKDRLIARHVARHGRQPSATTVIKLRQTATLATRPDKQLHSLAELTDAWRQQASALLDDDPVAWASRLLATESRPVLLRADDLPSETIGQVGRAVLSTVGEKRSTWRRWNLWAEASRQVMGLRFASSADREAIVDLVVDAAQAASLQLTPPELAFSPLLFQRVDGASVFRPRHTTLYTSSELLAAEDRLLGLARTRTGPTVPAAVVERAGRQPDSHGRMLAADQAAAITAVGVSGQVVDVLLGPAGAGKTTAMQALRRAWEAAHGPASVVGLAPSAAAAQVLADELGIATENTAKWLHDHQAGTTRLHQGQLVIVDEASLAGTITLDRLTSHAAQVGAKVLLVGDWAQLAAVDAGGAFALLVRDRDDAPELTDVRRFHQPWEADASLRLRVGDEAVIDTYAHHGRLQQGDHADMLDAAYQAWRADLDAGRASVMLAPSSDLVAALNQRARDDRILDGHVAPQGGVQLHDGSQASVGDLVITRRNDRRLVASTGWVRNGDRWTVAATHPDGSATVRRAAGHAAVVLPAVYVAAHLDLAYALTPHRAQGATVTTAHTVVTAAMTREALYVGMTRGRAANTAYVATDQPDAEPHDPAGTGGDGRAVLARVMCSVGAETSAHEGLEHEQQRWGGIAQLAAAYETIATQAQQDRWVTLIQHSGLTPQQLDQTLRPEHLAALTALLRLAEANHHDVDTLLPHLVAQAPLEHDGDIAEELQRRLGRTMARAQATSRPRPAPRMIAGLIPVADGPMTTDMQRALQERQHLIEQRAATLADQASNHNDPWIQQLGTPPTGPRRRHAWQYHARTIAAYRDRYGITAESALGPAPTTTSQRRDAARAQAALQRAVRLTQPTALAPPSDPRPAQRHQAPARSL